MQFAIIGGMSNQSLNKNEQTNVAVNINERKNNYPIAALDTSGGNLSIPTNKIFIQNEPLSC